MSQDDFWRPMLAKGEPAAEEPPARTKQMASADMNPQSPESGMPSVSPHNVDVWDNMWRDSSPGTNEG